MIDLHHKKTCMKVYTNGTDTVVADNLEDVQHVVEETYGSTFAQEGWTLDEWDEVPSHETIKIRDVLIDGVATTVARTAAAWAACEPRGLLCSTEC